MLNLYNKGMTIFINTAPFLYFFWLSQRICIILFN